MKDIKDLKVALVHDYLTTLGGAEKVLWYLHEIFPEAPIYTSVYFKNKCGDPFDECDIRQSFVSKLPFQRLFFHEYKLFWQMAFEKFDFREYDLVISSTCSYANGIITPTDALHISYIHNVPRYLWHLPTSLHGTLWKGWENIILPSLEHYWRIWDRLASERPDHLIANSKVVQKRVKKYYRRDSAIVYPPVELDRFLENPVKKGNYFCYFGRIEQFKNLDIAIKACLKNKFKLKILGAGEHEKNLKKFVEDLHATHLVEFLGRLGDDELEEMVGRSAGFVFPGISEEFGIVLVEAMAAGKPVIAFESAGSKDIILNGKTGILVKDFSVDAFAEALKQAKKKKFDPEVCRRRAKKFSIENFKKGILNNVRECLCE